MVFVLIGMLIQLSFSFPNRIWLFKVTIAMLYFAIENHSFNIGLRLNWEEISGPAAQWNMSSKWNSPTHVSPSPEYPVRHVQWNDPLVFVQFESAWQLSVLMAHSSISERYYSTFLIAFNGRNFYLIQADSCLFTQCLGSWMPVTGTWEPFVATRVGI